MNYDGDDELERMRLRRQQRREARQSREETGRAGSYREDFNTEDSRRSTSGREHGRSPQAARYTSDEFGAQYGTHERSGHGARERSRREQDYAERGHRAGSRTHREESRPGTEGRRSRGEAGSRTGGQEQRTSGSASFRSGYNGPKSSAGGRKGRGGRGGRRGFAGLDRRKKILVIAGGVILALILLAAAALAYVNHAIFGNMQQLDFDEKKVQNVNLSDDQLAQMKGHWMVACFGVDSRAENGKMNVGKGSNADVNMICSIDMETGEIKLVSVFRDTYLNISDKNTYNKINAAYAIGGPEQAVAALNKNLDLNITQYATFNWKAVADGINILGGVDIELSENERSWINAYITETVNETGIGSHQIEKAGLVHMDGVQAVAYGRIRYGDTDYARTERQRIVLQAAFDKAKTADWATINNVIQTVMPQLATNIEMTDLIPLARNLSKFHIGDTKGFPMARGEANIGKNGDCVIPQTLESNVVELHQFLFGTENYQPSSKVQSYSSHISEVSGMYNEGKSIDHVPVDQGLNASSYIKARQKRAAEKAAAEQKAREEAEAAQKKEDETTESLQTETQAETADYFGDWNEEDWDEFWGGGNWYDDWGDEGIGSDDGATGPGAEVSGPGAESGTTKPGTSKPGTSKPGTSKPGTSAPGNSSNSSSGSSQTSPGGSTSDKSSQDESSGAAQGSSGSENGSSGSKPTSPGSSGSGTSGLTPDSPAGGAGTGNQGSSDTNTSGGQAISDPPEQEQEAAGPGGSAGPAGPAA